MNRLWIVLIAALAITTSATAATFEGVNLPDSYPLAGETLHLNGQGMRKKFFFSIYIGALYTPQRVTSANQVLDPQLPKVIRMHFVYDKVPAEKLRGGFAESLDNNIAEFSTTPEGKAFLALFSFDGVKDDTIDMLFSPEGVLTLLHNGKEFGRLSSAATCRAVLNMYFGSEPIESLRAGMLGE